MKLPFFLLLTAISLFSLPLSAQNWSLEHLPGDQAIAGASGTVVGNKIIIAGGVRSDQSSSDGVFIYDVTTGTWTEATLAAPRESLPGVTVGNKAIFAGGGKWVPGTGYVGSPLIDIYDAALDVWTTDTLPLAAPRLGVALAAIGDKVYMAGGQDINGIESNQMFVYHPETGIFQNTTMPYAASYFIAAAADFKLLLFDWVRCMIFDTATETWSIHEFDTERTRYGCTIVTPEEVWFVGGLPYLIDVYNISDGTWSTRNTQYRHVSALGAYVDGKVLIAGGGNGVTSSSTSIVEVYNVALDGWEDTQLLSAPRQFFLWNPMTAPVIGNKAYFPGGMATNDWTGFSGNMDIYSTQVSGTNTSVPGGFEITCSPSPFSEYVQIRPQPSQSTEGGLIEICNLHGRLMYSQILPGSFNKEITIPTQEWSAGAYLLRFRYKEGMAVRKIIKN